MIGATFEPAKPASLGPSRFQAKEFQFQQQNRTFTEKETLWRGKHPKNTSGGCSE
jgi:hypothetical protein